MEDTLARTPHTHTTHARTNRERGRFRKAAQPSREILVLPCQADVAFLPPAYPPTVLGYPVLAPFARGAVPDQKHGVVEGVPAVPVVIDPWGGRRLELH